MAVRISGSSLYHCQGYKTRLRVACNLASAAESYMAEPSRIVPEALRGVVGLRHEKYL
jgi:hypothetical protein